MKHIIDMDYMTKLNGIWMQHAILFVYFLMISGTRKDGIRLLNETGVITSPGYPNGYPNSIAYIWLINTTQSKYIELTFEDFDVEPYTNCGADYVKIRNKKPNRGNFKDVPQIDLTSKEASIKISSKGPYCNSNKPPRIITSSTNLMAIVFIADSSESYRGFKATYRSLPKKDCNFLKSADHGSVMTPGYPTHYPMEGECHWLISVQAGSYVRLEFLEFDLDSNPQLCMDEIFVFDGDNELAPIMIRGCRFKPRVLYSSTNRMKIKFTSRGYHRSRGFKAVYTTSSSKGCGGHFHLPNGTLISPNFNLQAQYTYPAFSDCLWTVTAPRGFTISFKFVFFDVPSGKSVNCDEDFLEIMDGSNSKAKRIGRYCNARRPNVVTSTGNALYMKFTSNQRQHGKGFQIEYRRHSAACDQPLGMEDGRIPNYRISSSSYLRENTNFHQRFGRLNGKHAWCSQVQINNQIGEYLQIDFKDPTKVTGFATQGYKMDETNEIYYVTKYRIEYSNNGGRFFIAYRRNDAATKYETFSGNTDAKTVRRITFRRPIITKLLRIYPLGYVHGQKRVICLRAEVYGCKFDFGDGKLFQSPDSSIIYNGLVSKTKSSHWIISPSVIYSNAVFYVMPLYFNINCQKARLIISDGARNETFCGNNKPPSYLVFSASRQLWIHFEAKQNDIKDQSFGLQYFTENLGTGKLLRSRRGVIRSKHYVIDRVSNQTTSTWVIIQPNHKRLMAQFRTLKLGAERNGKCNEYIEIKDGLLESSRSFGNFCIEIPLKPLISTGHCLRIVYHKTEASGRSRRGLDIAKLAFEIVYSTLDRRSFSDPKHEEILPENSNEKEQKINRGRTLSCYSPDSYLLALVVLCFTLHAR